MPIAKYKCYLHDNKEVKSLYSLDSAGHVIAKCSYVKSTKEALHKALSEINLPSGGYIYLDSEFTPMPSLQYSEHQTVFFDPRFREEHLWCRWCGIPYDELDDLDTCKGCLKFWSTPGSLKEAHLKKYTKALYKLVSVQGEETVLYKLVEDNWKFLKTVDNGEAIMPAPNSPDWYCTEYSSWHFLGKDFFPVMYFCTPIKSVPKVEHGILIARYRVKVTSADGIRSLLWINPECISNMMEINMHVIPCMEEIKRTSLVHASPTDPDIRYVYMDERFNIVPDLQYPAPKLETGRVQYVVTYDCGDHFLSNIQDPEEKIYIHADSKWIKKLPSYFGDWMNVDDAVYQIFLDLNLNHIEPEDDWCLESSIALGFYLNSDSLDHKIVLFQNTGHLEINEAITGPVLKSKLWSELFPKESTGSGAVTALKYLTNHFSIIENGS